MTDTPSPHDALRSVSAVVPDELAFNVNDNVRVRLTDWGRDILNGENYTAKLKQEVDGWTTWQLWELMSLFGERMFNGCDVPFETEIRIPLSATPPADAVAKASSPTGDAGLVDFADAIDPNAPWNRRDKWRHRKSAIGIALLDYVNGHPAANAEELRVWGCELVNEAAALARASSREGGAS